MAKVWGGALGPSRMRCSRSTRAAIPPSTPCEAGSLTPTGPLGTGVVDRAPTNRFRANPPSDGDDLARCGVGATLPVGVAKDRQFDLDATCSLLRMTATSARSSVACSARIDRPLKEGETVARCNDGGRSCAAPRVPFAGLSLRVRKRVTNFHDALTRRGIRPVGTTA
jgi:hypothetical protein